MIAAKVLAWSVVIAMTAAIIYGFTSGDFGENGSQIWALPWGKVTLIDLYAGIAIFAGWIAIRETNRARTVLWWLALVLLGNFAAGVYLVRALFESRDTTELLIGKAKT